MIMQMRKWRKQTKDEKSDQTNKTIYNRMSLHLVYQRSCEKKVH